MTSSLRQNPPVETFQPLTPERWPDLEALFEHHGYVGSCWCMWWRMPSSEYDRLSSGERKGALKSLLEAGTPMGVLGYLEGEPCGWCSIAPRETYPRLERSPTLKRIDAAPVWSVACFYVAARARQQGFTARLLQAAVEYAKSQEAALIEGYPVELHQDETGRWRGIGLSSWFMGSVSTFEQVGFVEAARNKRGRKIMRLRIE